MASSGNETDSSSQDHFDTSITKNNVESQEVVDEPSIVKGKDRVEEELDFEEGSVESGENNRVDCHDEPEQNLQTDEPNK